MRLSKSFTPTEAGGHTPIDGYISSAAITSDPIFLAHVYGYAIAVSWPSTGTPVGSFVLQASNDVERAYSQGLPEGVPDPKLLNWVNIIPDTTINSSAGSPGLWNISNAMYRWVRIVYTPSSGSITLSAKVLVKGMD